MIGLCLSGAAGRIGSQILKVLPEFPEFSLVSTLESPTCEHIGRLCSGDVRYACEVEQAVSLCDIVVDFSSPDASGALSKACALKGKPLLVGTTGHSNEEVDVLKKAAQNVAVLLAPNTSTGVAVMRELCARAAGILGSDFDIEVLELHHSRKKDAPSGTALSLAASLNSRGSLTPVSDRSSRKTARQADELGVASLRGGDVLGEHTVYFLGDGERLEVTHRVSDRSIFARGALRLARNLLEKAPGFYSVEQVLGL